MRKAGIMIVALVTVLRAFAAWKLPLTGDEAYYWEWAKHLAFGYTDHPPMVAYLIFPFDWITANPFWLRFPFLCCGVIATIAAAATAGRLTGDERAAIVTALALTLAPLLTIGFVVISPDAPLMAAWALCLYLTVRASQTHARQDYVLLGVVMAFALLSKMFALALVAGIVAWALSRERRSLFREGLTLSLAVAALLYAPFLIWNATHHWATFDFTFAQRHVAEPMLLRPLLYLTTAAGAYSPGLWIAALLVLVRPRNALLAWTAVPLAAFLVLLNFSERVELSWMDGPYVSLCTGMGIASVSLWRRARVAWIAAAAIPAFVLIPVLFAAAVFPAQLYGQFRASGSTLRNGGPFEIFSYWSLAKDVRRLADANRAIVVTDGYGFSSQMDFEAGIAPVVIGYSAQGAEARRWYDADMRPQRILFVDKESLVPRAGHPEDGLGRPDFRKHLAAACGTVRTGTQLSYAYTDPTGHTVPARTYFLTWCDAPKPHALRILRWETVLSP